METLRARIQKRAESIFEDIRNLRRHFHTFPELSGDEHQTSAYICRLLDQWKIPYRSGIAETGIVAALQGRKTGNQCIALRADMDALPVEEATGLEFQSRISGVMHACGHDMHMASLLGTLLIMSEMTEEFGGTLKCFFQPSEEKYPGGAIQMIQAGVLNNPSVDGIFGQHVYPDLPAGKVGFRTGKYMASTDEIYITVKGRGGHAASPQQNIDPVVAGAHVVAALQQIVSRKANPAMPTVLSFGRFIANGRTNIIPDEARLEGTLRTFDEEWRMEAHRLITQIAKSSCEAYGAACEVFIDRGYPYLENHPELTARAMQYAKDFLGDTNVVDLDLRMTAEDFAYFAQKVPGCFYRLGTAVPGGSFTPLHSPRFMADEESLVTGSGLMAYLALQELTR